MAIYYVNGEKIKIPTDKKPFGQGSEGSLYLIKDKLYKIYDSFTLNEGFGNKKIYHQSLLELNGMFEKFILPDALIFDENGTYCGYVTPLVGNKSKNKDGVTILDWDNFIGNLRDIENEIDLLSENRFLTVDVGYHNSIFSKENGNLYMIDPGRYHHQSYFTICDYKRKNKLILEDYFTRMLEREILSFKLVTSKKVKPLISMIKDEKNDISYSEYFESVKEKESSVHEFFKVKGRYIH